MRIQAASAFWATVMLVLGPSTPASASFDALDQESLEASTTFWSVEPAPKNGSPQKAELALSWTVVSNTAYSYFDAVNTGAGQLSGVTFSATSVSLSANSGSARLTFELCDKGLWDSVDNTCSGEVVELGTYNGANTVSAEVIENLAVGERLALRARTQQNRRNSLGTTVSFSADRSHARAALTTNS
jgi:hypothetical protein